MPHRTLAGILLMVAAMACFSVMNTLIRGLSLAMPSGQMVFLRNVMAFGIMVPLAVYHGPLLLRTGKIGQHFWRAAVGTVAMQLWFYSLSVLPLTLATALSFTTPIFATVFAIFFLGERAGLRRWAAVLAGFAGALVILRPEAHAADPRALFVLASSAAMAFASILVKSLTRTESPETIVFYMALFMIPFSLPLALPVWQPVSNAQLLDVFLVALFSTFAHLLLTRAYQRADMVALMPFDFTRLLFTAMLAYCFFGEVLDGRTALGALIIVVSALYIARREALHRRRSLLAEESVLSAGRGLPGG